MFYPLIFFAYAVTGRGDGLAPATGTAAGPGEFGSLAEDESAALAFRSFQYKCACGVAGNGLHNVRKVFLNLALRHAHELGQLMRG